MRAFKTQSVRVAGHGGLYLAVDAHLPTTTPSCSVLMMHGGGQTRHSWGGTAEALAARGCAVFVYDARGHGDSDWSETGEYTFEAMALDLLAVRDSLVSSGPVIGVGASMGGHTIVKSHELRDGNGWHGVVLVDVTPRLELQGTQRIMRFMSAYSDGFSSLDDVAEAIAEYTPGRPRAQNPEGLLKVVRQGRDGRWRWHWDPRVVEEPIRLLSEPEKLVAYLKQIEASQLKAAGRMVAPTLLVRGLLSDVVSDETIALFRRHVPHATVADVGHAGHMVAGDSNAAFTDSIEAFIDIILGSGSLDRNGSS